MWILFTIDALVDKYFLLDLFHFSVLELCNSREMNFYVFALCCESYINNTKRVLDINQVREAYEKKKKGKKFRNKNLQIKKEFWNYSIQLR